MIIYEEIKGSVSCLFKALRSNKKPLVALAIEDCAYAVSFFYDHLCIIVNDDHSNSVFHKRLRDNIGPLRTAAKDSVVGNIKCGNDDITISILTKSEFDNKEEFSSNEKFFVIPQSDDPSDSNIIESAATRSWQAEACYRLDINEDSLTEGQANKIAFLKYGTYEFGTVVSGFWLSSLVYESDYSYEEATIQETHLTTELSHIKNTLIYDIETADYSNSQIACVAVFSYKDNSLRIYTDNNKSDLQKVFNEHDRVVGYNQKTFDYKQLKKSWGITYSPKKDLDLYELFCQNTGQRKGKLGEISLLNFGVGKIYDAEVVQDMWSSGKKDQVISRCMHDVILTKLIYDELVYGNIKHPFSNQNHKISNNTINKPKYKPTAVKWSDEDLKILTSSSDFEEICSLLPARTRSSIGHKLIKLGLATAYWKKPYTRGDYPAGCIINNKKFIY